MKRACFSEKKPEFSHERDFQQVAGKHEVKINNSKFILYILAPRLNQYKDQRASYANFGFFSILGAKLKAIVISPTFICNIKLSRG